MPCYDSHRYYEEICQMGVRLDLATNMLCRMIRHFGVIPGDAELTAWQVEHDEMDRRRPARERSEP